MNYTLIFFALMLMLAAMRTPAATEAPTAGTMTISAQAADTKLWYDKPAADNWMTEALPIGNGDLGVVSVGDGLSCLYTSAGVIVLDESANITLHGVSEYIAKGGPSESGGDGAHLWKDCYFGPRPGTSQWQGGEGFMFNATRHGTTLDRVTICHTSVSGPVGTYPLRAITPSTTLPNLASINGRLLAQSAVQLDANTVTAP